MVKIGIIGGSGVDDPGIISDAVKKVMKTPYGAPSSEVVTGKVNGVECVVIARHGPGHKINPTNVNYRANIQVMKDLKVTHILAPTACGSLQEKIKPGDLIFPNQFIDRTTKRASTFYDHGKVCHVSMADPFCDKLRRVLVESSQKLKLKYHDKGTIVTIEGPRFSTRAESHLFRSWKGDIINMTTVPEATLAREAGICYQPIAMSTDYDCWKEHEEAVNVDAIMGIMKENGEKVKKLLVEVVSQIKDWECYCKDIIKTSCL